MRSDVLFTHYELRTISLYTAVRPKPQRAAVSQRRILAEFGVYGEWATVREILFQDGISQLIALVFHQTQIVLLMLFERHLGLWEKTNEHIRKNNFGIPYVCCRKWC